MRQITMRHVGMRHIGFVTASLLLSAVTVFAEPAIPRVVIKRDSTPSDPCVDVRIGNDSVNSYGCLNQRLRKKVDTINPSVNLPPIDARSADTKLGIVNVPALKQQYGPNYGISVVPYRPPR